MAEVVIPSVIGAKILSKLDPEDAKKNEPRNFLFCEYPFNVESLHYKKVFSEVNSYKRIDIVLSQIPYVLTVFEMTTCTFRKYFDDESKQMIFAFSSEQRSAKSIDKIEKLLPKENFFYDSQSNTLFTGFVIPEESHHYLAKNRLDIYSEFLSGFNIQLQDNFRSCRSIDFQFDVTIMYDDDYRQCTFFQSKKYSSESFKRVEEGRNTTPNQYNLSVFSDRGLLLLRKYCVSLPLKRYEAYIPADFVKTEYDIEQIIDYAVDLVLSYCDMKTEVNVFLDSSFTKFAKAYEGTCKKVSLSSFLNNRKRTYEASLEDPNLFLSSFSKVSNKETFEDDCHHCSKRLRF